MIRICGEKDFEQTYEIINDGAAAYHGRIPADRLHNPYMSREELQHEIAQGVVFYGFEEPDARLLGVMGTQDIDHPTQPVTLIRHAYVRTSAQGKGIGTELLQHLRTLTTRPVLIGTWADASWAIGFYMRHGFEIVSIEEKDRLLRTYWNISDRQIETSVVLADTTW